jgi:hypothetical protein
MPLAKDWDKQSVAEKVQDLHIAYIEILRELQEVRQSLHFSENYQDLRTLASAVDDLTDRVSDLAFQMSEVRKKVAGRS